MAYPTTSEPPKSSSDSNWIDWARLALGAYQSLQKPEYKNHPLSPEQKKIYDLYISSLMNPDLKDLASKTAKGAGEILGGYGGLGWNSPTTFSGEYGYRGNAAPGGMPPRAVNQQVRPPGIDKDKLEGGPSGGFGQRRFNRTWEPTGSGPEESFGRSIYDYYTQNPGGRLGEGQFPTTGGPLDPNRPRVDGEKGLPGQQWTPGSSQTQYGSPADLMAFVSWLRSQGVRDAGKIGIGFLGGGLGGAALAGAKVLWDRFQNAKKGGGNGP